MRDVLSSDEINKCRSTGATIFGLPVTRAVIGGNTRYSILCVYCYFKDPKEKVTKVNIEGPAGFKMDEETGEYNFVNTEKRQRVEQREDEHYYAVFLGGYNMISAGVVPNQIRSVDNPSEVQLYGTHLVLNNKADDIDRPSPNSFMRAVNLQARFNDTLHRYFKRVNQIRGPILAYYKGALPQIDGKKGFESDALILEQINNGLLQLDPKRLGSGQSQGQPVFTLNFDGDLKELNIYKEALMTIQALIDIELDVPKEQGQYTAATTASVSTTSTSRVRCW